MRGVRAHGWAAAARYCCVSRGTGRGASARGPDTDAGQRGKDVDAGQRGSNTDAGSRGPDTDAGERGGKDADTDQRGSDTDAGQRGPGTNLRGSDTDAGQLGPDTDSGHRGSGTDVGQQNKSTGASGPCRATVRFLCFSMYHVITFSSMLHKSQVPHHIQIAVRRKSGDGFKNRVLTLSCGPLSSCFCCSGREAVASCRGPGRHCDC